MKSNLVALLALATVSLGQAQDNQMSLSRALELARANRPGVAAAQLRVNSARLMRRSLGAFPSTRILLGYSSNSTLDDTDDDLVLVQPLDFFGRTSAARAVGDASILRAEAELQQVLAEVQASVVEQFSEAAAARALAQSALQSQEIAEQLYEAMKNLVAEGRAPAVQLTRVGIELERVRLTVNQRTAEERASLERLSGLLNVPTAQVAVLGFADIAIEIVEPALLQRQRADLLLLAAEAKSAEAEARVASLGNRPELELQGRRSSWHDRDERYGLRLQLSYPINDFGRSRNETAAARTKAEAARRTLADATGIALSELAAARLELAAAGEQIQRYQTIIESARSLVEKSRIGFAEKAITLVELLEATRALREVEEGFVETRLRQARAQARYLRASGRILEVGR